jgi:hypothetical protein
MKTKYVTPTLALIIVFFACIFSNCGPQKSKEQILHEKMSQDSTAAIFQNFTTDSLSDSTINAFESRATQKISDLRDYISILSDTSLDKTFKQQAMNMALKLFISKKSLVPNPLITGDDNIMILSLLDSLKTGSLANLRLLVSSIEILEHAKKQGKVYEGIVEFDLRYKGGETRFGDDTKVQCMFSIKKIKKAFGTESKLIWEVFLGNIEIADKIVTKTE